MALRHSGSARKTTVDRLPLTPDDRFSRASAYAPEVQEPSWGVRLCDQMAKDHGPQIKDDAVYEALRREGASPAKAARIANAKAAGTLDHEKGGKRLETRTRAELLAEAVRIGIKGRSRMNKAELADAIRHS